MVKVVTKIDDLLENFVGIKDQELSTTIYDLAKGAKDAEAFASKLDEQLSDFEFPDDFVLDVSLPCHKGTERPGVCSQETTNLLFFFSRLFFLLPSL